MKKEKKEKKIVKLNDHTWAEVDASRDEKEVRENWKNRTSTKVYKSS
jgi:hypothetical protein